MWAMAQQEIQKASRSVFVGYRFPQTDAQARNAIFTYIKRAYDAENLSKIQVVL